jgi:hypothetical protein
MRHLCKRGPELPNTERHGRAQQKSAHLELLIMFRFSGEEPKHHSWRQSRSVCFRPMGLMTVIKLIKVSPPTPCRIDISVTVCGEVDLPSSLERARDRPHMLYRLGDFVIVIILSDIRVRWPGKEWPRDNVTIPPCGSRETCSLCALLLG